jgi:hypothetical protein
VQRVQDTDEAREPKQDDAGRVSQASRCLIARPELPFIGSPARAGRASTIGRRPPDDFMGKAASRAMPWITRVKPAAVMIRG